MKRRNIKITAKFTDELVGEKFRAEFTYETLNSVLVEGISATIKEGSKTAYVNKMADSTGQNINGEFEFETVGIVLAEIDAIILENTAKEKK